MAPSNELGRPVGDPVPDWTPPSAPGRVTIAGTYCRLEPLDPERHAAQLFAANAADGSGAMWTYLPYGPFATPATYRDWIETTCLGADPLFFAIVDTSSVLALGVASYLRINPPDGTIEIGHIAYSPGLQRTTAATEAMYLLARHVFDLGYRRYEWKCDALNEPSRRAAIRLGFSYEGTFRQATMYKGRNRDTAWYAMIDRDWPAIRAAYEEWLDPANFDQEGRQRETLQMPGTNEA